MTKPIRAECQNQINSADSWFEFDVIALTKYGGIYPFVICLKLTQELLICFIEALLILFRWLELLGEQIVTHNLSYPRHLLLSQLFSTSELSA